MYAVQVTLYVVSAAAIALAVSLVILVARYRRMRDEHSHSRRRDTRFPEQLASDVDSKIRLSKKQLETTLDAITDMICVIDPDFTIARVNKSYADHVGKSVRALPGEKCFAAFWGATDVCPDCPARKTIQTGMTMKRANVVKRVAGEDRMFEMEAYAVTDESERVVNVIEHIRDITDEKRINEQLIRSEKLASIGIMTAGIAHEMNNPLSGISGTAVNMLKMPEKFGLNEKGLDRMTMILECAARATMIMKDLLRFSQRQEAVRIPTDLPALVKKAASGVRLPGSSRIHRTYAFDPDLPRVRCDPSKIEQVIVNVVTNAIQSIIEKRRMSARNDSERPQETLHIGAKRQGDEVCVEVVDNGVGVPPEIGTKLFDPFFTTRVPGEGTGLGLSICHRIMEEHQGRISIGTADGLTTVRIVLSIGKDPWENIDRQRQTAGEAGR